MLALQDDITSCRVSFCLLRPPIGEQRGQSGRRRCSCRVSAWRVSVTPQSDHREGEACVCEVVTSIFDCLLAPQIKQSSSRSRGKAASLFLGANSEKPFHSKSLIFNPFTFQNKAHEKRHISPSSFNLHAPSFYKTSQRPMIPFHCCPPEFIGLYLALCRYSISSPLVSLLVM